jgi:hypothetical protein
VKKHILTVVFILGIANHGLSQEKKLDLGELRGNFQLDAQYYNRDSLIGAPPVPEKMRAAGFANLLYRRGKFSSGIRYEAYQYPLLGFDQRYRGEGIPYRYVTYTDENFEITAGNFYEQFGSGMILRTYEERGLGYDNVFDGFRVKIQPYQGIYLKGLIGKQRLFFSLGDGIVRGADAEISLNELLDSLMLTSKLQVRFGGSFVSKYQKDEDPVYILPENVGAWASRLSLAYGNFTMDAEYMYKDNDPSTVNNFIYKSGEGLLLTLNYARSGLGVSLSAKRTDNLNFRSNRTETGNNLMINYLPALTKQHSYTLAATIYPYASQPNGEMAFQSEITYKFKKETALGGKYGMDLTLNASLVHGIDTSKIIPFIGYESPFFKVGKRKFFHDFNIELTKRLSEKFKVNLNYLNFYYDKDVIQGLSGYGVVHAHIGIMELQYKIKPKHTLRTELQMLYTKQDEGSWAMALLEYTISPKWFFALMDQYNYGNPVEKKRIHYFFGSLGRNFGNNRLILSYGRQRAGIFCVGGVCRNVPASNGFTFTVISNF